MQARVTLALCADMVPIAASYGDFVYSGIRQVPQHFLVCLSGDPQALEEEWGHNVPLVEDDPKGHGGGKLRLINDVDLFDVLQINCRSARFRIFKPTIVKNPGFKPGFHVRKLPPGAERSSYNNFALIIYPYKNTEKNAICAVGGPIDPKNIICCANVSI